MTTSIKVFNHGPRKVRIRLRDIALSARKVDSDNSEKILNPGEEADYLAVWDTRKIVIEEVDE